MDKYVETKLVSLSSNSATIKNNGAFLSQVEFYTKGLLIATDDIEKIEISVVHCEIPVSFYNINYTCNQIRYSFDNTAFIVKSIPVGNYNAYSLITALQNAMNDGPIQVSITINKVTGILTFVTTAEHTITISGLKTIPNIYPFLGFSNDEAKSATATSISTPYPCNLLGITRLNIVSNELSTYNYSSSGGNVSYLASIPVDQPSYGLIVYENRSMTRNLLQISDIYKIDIEIRDQFYNLVNFNNTDWSILFCLFITRNPAKLNMSNILTQNPSTLAETKDVIEEPTNQNIKDIQLLSG